MRGYEMPRFVHISTDEVYGDVPDGASVESDALAPSSPYAASKAAGDHLVQAWGRTYGLPWNIIRPSNCYGPHQYPEKLIPKAIRWMLLGRKVPIHGDGNQKRFWLNVEDCATAILTALDRAPNGEIYNVGGNTEASVARVATEIGSLVMDGRVNLLETVREGYTRAGMDRRYCVNDTKLRQLGWTPIGNLWADLPGIVAQERKVFRW